MRYYVTGIDGRRYGPAELETLRQWLTEGRLGQTALVEPEGFGQKLRLADVLAVETSPPVIGAKETAASSPPYAGAAAAAARATTPQPATPYQQGTSSAGFGRPQTVQQYGRLAGNDSGSGTTAVLPEELRGWNWGAFCLSWVWGCGHSTWIAFLAWVPYLGLIMLIVLGVKGNEWAWQNRRWESPEHFRATQRVWANWGIGLWVASLVLFILLLLIAAVSGVGLQPDQFQPY